MEEPFALPGLQESLLLRRLVGDGAGGRALPTATTSSASSELGVRIEGLALLDANGAPACPGFLRWRPRSAGLDVYSMSVKKNCVVPANGIEGTYRTHCN